MALVTGAGPNIGSGIALALARYGARVACNDLELEAAKAAVRRIERHGGVGLAVSGDVSVESDVLANMAPGGAGRADAARDGPAGAGARGHHVAQLLSVPGDSCTEVILIS